jgi:bacteriocin biosynthesis cyclodehydratase domain-containing protein
MVLKLDPGVAMVWRDPFSLQFGVDPVRTVLREVSNPEERMIAALSAGISRSGLSMIATAAGARERDAELLLQRLEPLLLAPESPIPTRCVGLVGSGSTIDVIASALVVAGVQVIVGPTVPDSPCDLGIAIAHYVLDPESYGYWLRRDLPHLPVVFGDESVTVGPLVEPGVTACLYCLEHYRRDADASWSAIASQLWGRTGECETPLVSLEVTARVTRAVLRRLDGLVPTSAMSTRIDVRTGETTHRIWAPHPECGCIDLPAEQRVASTPTAGQPEIDSARGSDRPRTLATDAARA